MALHVLPGDALLDAHVAAGLAGERLVWREAAIDGPLALDMGSPALRDARARYFATELGVSPELYQRDFDEREAGLRRAASHDEVVLWFERDLFCELHLLDLLARLAGTGPRVSLVHPPRLDADADLRACHATRHRCSDDELACAPAAWAALVATDPRPFLAMRVDAPWLDALLLAMQADQLGRFADRRGLSRFDALVLTELEDGPRSPLELFACVRAHEHTRGLGLGDLQVWLRLRELAARELIHLAHPLPHASAEPLPLGEPSVSLRELGRATLHARSHARDSLRGLVGGATLAAWIREGEALVAVA